MIDLLSVDFSDYLKVEKLSEQNVPDSFSASIQEYSDYLLNRALKSQESMIANTYLLTENDSGKVMAFISFVCDSVSFTVDEKSDVSLADFPFSNFPALKVAQLAVSVEFKKKYINIGSFLLSFARIQAFMLNEFTACRFLTVDADIENNPSVIEFYKKNGFQRLSDKKYTKKTKICCMYKDILS